jgi:hypothetical protein
MLHEKIDSMDISAQVKTAMVFAIELVAQAETLSILLEKISAAKSAGVLLDIEKVQVDEMLVLLAGQRDLFDRLTRKGGPAAP